MEDKLKKAVCEMYEGKITSSKDCSCLSAAVYKTTRRNISPTTLRRFFGLLPSKTGFSRYNLDTLSVYAGYPDYAGFCNNNERSKHEAIKTLREIHNEIIQITRYTLAGISRKALTEFSKTIPRQMLNFEINRFIQSDYFIFPVIAPGGYGKTTALAHWVISAQDNHFVCFFSASFYYSMISSYGNMNRLISLEHGKLDNIYNVFLRESYSIDEKLVLVIDALDEISSEPEKLLDLMNYILDTASLFAESKKVKIIFSVREAVWQNHLANLIDKHKDINWFADFTSTMESGFTNMPLLSNSEIKDIISNYNKTNHFQLIYESIPWYIKELLRNPINLFFANELLKTGKTPERISQLDITRKFIEEFVFKGKFAEQKEDLLWSVLELLKSNGESSDIAKNDLKMTFPIHLKREAAYFKAYNELLHAGILTEEREKNRYGIYQTKIAFKHQNVLQFTYSLYIIKENGVLNKQLFVEICNSKRNSLWISQVIAILYELAYDGENYESIADFCYLPLAIIESFNVRIAVGNSFRRKNAITNKLICRYAETRTGRKLFFENFVDTNYLFNNYRFRITEYLKHETNTEQQLFGNCILFLADFLKLNFKDCHAHFDKIKSIHPDSSVYPWPIGRKVTSHILYEYFFNNNTIPDLEKFIADFSKIAYSYPGYLEVGLIEFELSVMTGLILVREYSVLEKMLEKSFKTYKLLTTNQNIPYIIRQNQNALPEYFLEYARFKLGKCSPAQFIPSWINALENYHSTFDDFQYLILLNWFVCDGLKFLGQTEKSLSWYNSAMELSRFAGYDFYTAFLLINDPIQRTDHMNEAGKLLIKSGIRHEKIFMGCGPSFSQ